MTLHEFDALLREAQLLGVFTTGVLLAFRWREGKAINLYHLPGGVFVEVYYEVQATQLVGLQSFTSAAPLESYLPSIELPEDL